MTPSTAEPVVLNEEKWNAWLAKGKRRDKATARKFRIVAGVVLPLIVVVAVFLYLR